ncbi:hypothetical protein AVEN_237860-1 [Araneus ventricosus]|uniref:Uncharacterized protein n=1 Tax=Araneus ventricosus TaxID=182803 RepID=A0A4Y2L909_ARAVE|nr:hypothetical protein AVEN_237860-1 [Araneus ventricosus]
MADREWPPKTGHTPNKEREGVIIAEPLLMSFTCRGRLDPRFSVSAADLSDPPDSSKLIRVFDINSRDATVIRQIQLRMPSTRLCFTLRMVVRSFFSCIKMGNGFPKYNLQSRHLGWHHHL